MSVCKDCIHYEICDKYVAPNESFPEVDGCKAFKAKTDVVEVRHGEWVKKDLNNPLYESKQAPHCSICGEMSFIRYKYCPNCGAKMDGERGEE